MAWFVYVRSKQRILNLKEWLVGFLKSGSSFEYINFSKFYFIKNVNLSPVNNFNKLASYLTRNYLKNNKLVSKISFKFNLSFLKYSKKLFLSFLNRINHFNNLFIWN